MDWIGYLTAGGIGGGIVQVFRVFLDWRRGVKADERDAQAERRQAKLDESMGIDRFADNLQESLAAERERLDAIQGRVDTLTGMYEAEQTRRRCAVEYAAMLRQDIIDGRPPPPREWPEGIR